MTKSSELFQQYARVGAQARLTELQAEIQAIESAFPDLAGGRRPGRPRLTASSTNGQPAEASEPVARKGRRRKPMTAAQKAEVSARMKRYWAGRRKTRAAGKAKSA